MNLLQMKPNMDAPVETVRLVSDIEARILFIKVLSDVYYLKEFMVAQLPEITYRTERIALKLQIVQAGCTLNSQLLRMDMAISLLQTERLLDGALPVDGLNYEHYMYNNIDTVTSYLNDVKLLNHIMLLVGIEVASFRLLDILSRPLRPKSVNVLMRDNLKEAIKNQNELIRVYHTYLD